MDKAENDMYIGLCWLNDYANDPVDTFKRLLDTMIKQHHQAVCNENETARYKEKHDVAQSLLGQVLDKLQSIPFLQKRVKDLEDRLSAEGIDPVSVITDDLGLALRADNPLSMGLKKAFDVCTGCMQDGCCEIQKGGIPSSCDCYSAKDRFAPIKKLTKQDRDELYKVGMEQSQEIVDGQD